MHHRVAERLGFCRVADLVDEVPKEELTDWLAVCWIDGWGEDYLRMASVVKELHDIFNVLIGYLGVIVAKSDFKTVEQCMPQQARTIRRKEKKVVEEPEATEQPKSDPTTDWMLRTLALYGKRKA